MTRARWLAAALVAAAVLVPIPALADEAAPATRPPTRPIDLQTAVATALGQNDVVAAERVDVEIAAAEASAAAGADDLVIEAAATGLTRDTEPVAGPFFQETELDALAVSAGVWKPLSTGGRVGLQLRDQVSRTVIRIETAPGMATDIDTTIHGPRAELVYVQPLLAGRGRRAAHAERRAAAARRDAQGQEARRAEAITVRDVTVTYWELAYAARAVAIHDSALALAREQLAITQARAEVGKASALEVQAVEQAIAARQAARLAARQAEVERALELRVLLALEDGDPRALAAADALDAPVTAPAAAGALERALAHSPDLRAMDAHAAAAGVELAFAAQATEPSLDLVVRGGPAGNADAASDAFAQLGRFDSFEASATLSFRMPLGNHAAEGRRDAARARARRLQHGADAIRGELIAAVQRALDGVELTAQRIDVAAQAARLARANVALEQDRWAQGAGTNFDVMARQDQLTAAEAALARAHADHRIAIAHLAYLTGD